MFCACCESQTQENLVEVVSHEILQTPAPQKKDEEAAPMLKEKAEAPSNIFTVTIESRGDFGVVLDDLGSRGPVIAAVNKGAAHDNGTLRKYDCILSVNGVESDVNRMWDILESPGKCTLTVLRPTEMAFKLKKSDDEPLGIHMNFKSYSAGIVLEEIKKGGQFDRFLDSLPEASRALPGDRFVAINGTHLKGSDLVEAVKKEASLEISALRY